MNAYPYQQPQQDLNQPLSGQPGYPAYNPDYGTKPSSDAPPQYYGQPQPSYQAYGAPPAYGAPQNPYPYGQPQPVYGQVVQTPYIATPIIQPAARNNDSDAIIAIVVFVAGFFFCPIWCGGFAYMKSNNGIAKLFSILSLVMCTISIVIIVIIVSVFVVFAKGVADQATCLSQNTVSSCYDTNGCGVCMSSSTNKTCMASSAFCYSTYYSSLDLYCRSFYSSTSCMAEPCMWCFTTGKCREKASLC
eukprot:TRINITY_DN8556_c0_g1_i1.p1 TRINITY_DN8556_c0_g1~~TRINITY_DN8556_c0_g1_i1.p1  ORF type:complete len:261 (+),score=32.91 TRINITY_DN8556_c0_g1_i1:48-785(+)